MILEQIKEEKEYLLSVKEYIQLLFSTKERPKYDINTDTYELNGKKYKVLKNYDIIKKKGASD
jgi:hypothetical protein